MVTILTKSIRGKDLRGFRSFGWDSSNNLPETATKTFWQIRSNVHKFNFVEYLKMEYFFSSLSLAETRCLFDAPNVLSDDLYVELLLAKQQVEDKKILLQRLNILRKWLGKNEWDLNLLYTLKGNLRCEILECRSAIRTATKFSGYVRNSSSVGSKNQGKIFIPEPEIFEWTKPVKIDFLRFLTVGEFTSGAPESVFFTLTRTKSSKRSPNQKLEL